jgi:hypothetical protein
MDFKVIILSSSKGIYLTRWRALVRTVTNILEFLHLVLNDIVAVKRAAFCSLDQTVSETTGR